jgi:hypothetical protein
MNYRNAQQQQLFWEFQRQIVITRATLKCAHCFHCRKNQKLKKFITLAKADDRFIPKKIHNFGPGFELELARHKKNNVNVAVNPTSAIWWQTHYCKLFTQLCFWHSTQHRLNGRKSKERKQRVRVFRSQKKRSVSCEIAHHRNTSSLLLHSSQNYRSRHLNILCTSLEGSHIYGVLRVHPSSQSSLCVLSAYKTLLLWESPTCYASLLSRETIP